MSVVNTATLDGDVAESLYTEAERRVMALWQERVIQRLATLLDKELRTDAPSRIPDTEQAAIAMIRQIGQQFQEAEQALAWAAKRLKDKGDVHGANQTAQARARTREHVTALLGAQA